MDLTVRYTFSLKNPTWARADINLATCKLLKTFAGKCQGREIWSEKVTLLRVTTVLSSWDTFGKFPCNIIHTWSTSWAQLYFTWWPVKILLNKKKGSCPATPPLRQPVLALWRGRFWADMNNLNIYTNQPLASMISFSSITALVSPCSFLTGKYSLVSTTFLLDQVCLQKNCLSFFPETKGNKGGQNNILWKLVDIILALPGKV